MKGAIFMKKRWFLGLFSVLLCTAFLLIGCENKGGQKESLRVLCIGNSYSRDSMYYVHSLAKLDGYPIETACLEADSASLRDHAYNFSYRFRKYQYWKTDASGTLVLAEDKCEATKALEDGTWDVIILQHDPITVGLPGTYGGDLDYLIDYLRDKTGAKLYWNMSWAMENQGQLGEYDDAFANYYENSQALMYNAIVDNLEKYIAGPGALFEQDFTGWIPTGAVIQHLRQTLEHDRQLTRNGYNLSLDIGRMAAATTVVKTLVPDFNLKKITGKAVAAFIDTDKLDEAIQDTDFSAYQFNKNHVNTVIDAVYACSNGNIPQRLATPEQPKSENADVTLVQKAAPLKVFFPDAAVLGDGTIIAGNYENVSHLPSYMEYADKLQEGSGVLKIYTGSSDGIAWNYDEPLLTIDQTQLEDWGIANIFGRYHSNSSNYTIMADPRDPNLAVVHADVTGDGTPEEVLLLTFFVYLYEERTANVHCYLTYSTDSGNNWAIPQELLTDSLQTCLKRGNIAAFADGQILIPYYRDNTAGSFLMAFDHNSKSWVLLADNEIPNLAAEESEKFNEVSLVAPDPDSDTVFAFCRDNGTLLRSEDRGATWELLGNEEGVIHQPGFAIMDSDQVLVTWALTQRPRNVYGKVFHTDGEWADTQANLIYETPAQTPPDMGDPSGVILEDGCALIVAYDTAYRSIVGVYTDLGQSQWQAK